LGSGLIIKQIYYKIEPKVSWYKNTWLWKLW